MAETAVERQGISIARACRAFGVSEAVIVTAQS